MRLASLDGGTVAYVMKFHMASVAFCILEIWKFSARLRYHGTVAFVWTFYIVLANFCFWRAWETQSEIMISRDGSRCKDVLHGISYSLYLGGLEILDSESIILLDGGQ